MIVNTADLCTSFDQKFGGVESISEDTVNERCTPEVICTVSQIRFFLNELIDIRYPVNQRLYHVIRTFLCVNQMTK